MPFINEQDLEHVEADFGEGAVMVYFRKMSLFEMDLVDKAGEKGKVARIVETLMVRARTESNTLMFEKKDSSKIRRQFDPDAVLDVVNAMNKSDIKDREEAGN